jgi:very-short-patch-repair endonuclease
LDGREHRQPKRRAKDQADDAKLLESGWTTVRIINDDALKDPAGVLSLALEKASLLQKAT